MVWTVRPFIGLKLEVNPPGWPFSLVGMLMGHSMTAARAPWWDAGRVRSEQQFGAGLDHGVEHGGVVLPAA